MWNVEHQAPSSGSHRAGVLGPRDKQAPSREVTTSKQHLAQPTTVAGLYTKEWTAGLGRASVFHDTGKGYSPLHDHVLHCTPRGDSTQASHFRVAQPITSVANALSGASPGTRACSTNHRPTREMTLQGSPNSKPDTTISQLQTPPRFTASSPAARTKSSQKSISSRRTHLYKSRFYQYR